MTAPRYTHAAQGLADVVRLLLDANENMARWLNQFTYFDLRAENARTRFLDLAAEYNTAKAGPRLREMKWPCGDIRRIYKQHIRPSMSDLLVQTESVSVRLDKAFSELGTADDDMVAFIYDTVVGGIDRFLREAEPAVDAGDIDTAERARLEFKVRARQLSERLERLSGGLAELRLQYSSLAGIAVTLSS